MRIGQATVAVMLALASAGCPGEDAADGGEGGAGGRTGGGGSGGAAGTGGTAGSGGLGDGGVDAGADAGRLDSGTMGTDGGGRADAGYRYEGTVSMTQQTQPLSGTMTAQFLEIENISMGCQTTKVGSCSITRCHSDGGTPRVPQVTVKSAGNITVDGTLVDGGLSLAADAGSSVEVDERLWHGGEPLTIAAGGAQVPAFSTQLTAPNTVTLVAPSCSATNCGNIRRDTPLNLSWFGANSGEVLVEMSASNPMEGDSSITCTYNAGLTNAIIPVGVLSQLVTTDAGFGSFWFGGAASARLDAGLFSVTVSASSTSVQGAAQYP